MYPSKMDRETDKTFKMIQSIRKYAKRKTDKNRVNWIFSASIVYREHEIKVHINSGSS